MIVYDRFYETVDSLILGGGTTELMVPHGSWPYAGKQAWLVSRSHTADELPIAQPVETFADDLSERPDRRADVRRPRARARRRGVPAAPVHAHRARALGADGARLAYRRA